MFKNKEHQQTLAVIDLVKSLGNTLAGQKAPSTERLEAMAMNIAALGISPDSIGEIEINWRAIKVDGVENLVPVMRMVSKGGEIKQLEQLDKQSS